MSFETIRVYRDLPIIAGFVQVPPCTEANKTSVTAEEAQNAIAGSAITRLSLGSGRMRGSKCGQQEFLRLPGIAPNEWYASDPVAEL